MLNSTPEVRCYIPGYEGIYHVTEDGHIHNSRKPLKTYRINSGYHALKLQKDGVKVSRLVHRIVAEVFIPNPENKAEVNHIDGDKTNNAVSNLEWVTSAENRHHAKDTGLWQYNVPGKGIKKSSTKSQYHNVRWDKSRGKWIGAVSKDNRPYKAKRFAEEIDAARYVNTLLDELGYTDRPRNQV